MKKLICKSFLLGLAVLLTVGALLWSNGDKSIDPYYKKFTTSAQNSLIIGTSRAAQGLVPDIFNQSLAGTQYELPVFNYAFTVKHSPFSLAYLNSIKKKLKRNTSRGLFIISVDPWAISIDKDIAVAEDENEKTSFIAGMKYVNMNPNFEYMVKYVGPFYHVLFGKDDGTTCLHEDGWLEVSPNMNAKRLRAKIQNKLMDYNKLSSSKVVSEGKIKVLRATVAYLKDYGDVFLVRIPVSEEMAKLEAEYCPDFSNRIHTLSKVMNVPYYDMINLSGTFQTTDGNHLFKEDGKEVSQLVSNFILASIKSDNITGAERNLISNKQ